MDKERQFFPVRAQRMPAGQWLCMEDLESEGRLCPAIAPVLPGASFLRGDWRSG
jgi:hypothetical protein